MSTDCIFCKLADGRIPTQFLHEDDLVVAFKDTNPQAPVHYLIVPRAHVASVAALETQHLPAVARCLEVAQRLAREAKVERRGFRLVVNTGQDAGQTVDHLHVHLLAGRPMEWPPG
jgi:histidine triad (HIT) family protein